MTEQQNFIQKMLARVNTFQQQHRSLAMPYAVVKKFSDDHAGFLAALIAYYGFISLFPLLIVATSIIQLVAANDTALQEQFLGYATSYFPAIGDTLADSINTPSRSGFALAIGLLLAFYGARGIANATQHALNEVWAVNRKHRPTFPKNTLKSFAMIIGAGTGFIGAAALIGYATAADHSTIGRIVLGACGFAILFGVYWAVLVFGPATKRKRPFANIPGALLAAIGLLILQAIGSYIITRQLKGQVGLTAQFAVVLALLFWLYLQAQLFLYSAELSSVRALKLWPRSLDDKKLLPADKKAHDLYKQRETFVA